MVLFFFVILREVYEKLPVHRHNVYMLSLIHISTMMQLERQKKILDYLNKNRKATTKELSQLLDVSTTTIRTDLNQMDRENLITKTRCV